MRQYFRCQAVGLKLAFVLGLFLIPFSAAQPAVQGIEPTIAAEGSAPLKHRWRGADGRPLPFGSQADILEFLRTARAVSVKELSQGTTRPRKVLLEKDGIKAHAVFRDVRIDKVRRREIRGISRLRFRDDSIFEAAAYQLSRLLGTDNVPPTVIRKIHARQGTLQLWVEGAMTEAQRRQRKRKPRDSVSWSRQLQVKRIFDHLVFNDDRNLGNWLIDSDWNVWLIDHTRTFSPVAKFILPGRIFWCPRLLWEKLKATDPEALRQRMKPYLEDGEIKALWQRWQLLKDHIQSLIDQKGEKAVLY